MEWLAISFSRGSSRSRDWNCVSCFAGRFLPLSHLRRIFKLLYIKNIQKSTVVLFSYASKVMLQILQARIQQYVNWEFPDIETGFWRSRGTRLVLQHLLDHGESMGFPGKKKKKNFRLTDCTKAFDCVDHNKLWKILKEMGVPDHLTCLLKNLQAKSRSNRTGHGTTDWLQIGKGVCEGCVLSPCLFNLYTEYIMWNAGVDESQAGIETAERHINNLR